MPTPTEIIEAHLADVDRGRRRYNARMLRLLVASLSDHGETRRAAVLKARIDAVSHVGGDPATNLNIKRLYKRANELLFERYQRKHQPGLLPDAASVRRRDLWRTYKKAAKKITSLSLECRLLMVTLTVSNRHSWRRRLEILNERRKKIRRLIGRHALWYAEAFDVQGAPDYSPHVHVLYLLPEAACDGLSTKLRKKARFRRHLIWIDHRDRDRARPLLPDWKRRQEWLSRLAYIMKVSGDCGERKFLDPAWSKEFERVRKDFLRKAGQDALNTQAMLVFYAGARKRTFSAGKIKEIGKVAPMRASPAKRSKVRRRKTSGGRPNRDPGRKKLRAVCRIHATMKARADDLEMSVRTLKKWMDAHNLRTPRGA